MIRNIGPPAPIMDSVRLEGSWIGPPAPIMDSVRLEGSWIGPPAPIMDRFEAPVLRNLRFHGPEPVTSR